MTMKFLLFCVVLFGISSYANVSALKCYSCSLNAGDVDQRCATDPANVETNAPIVNCNKLYCTSKRMEYKDPANKIRSMFRGCEDDPSKMNSIEEDDNTITYFRACKSDLCNGGNGKGSGSGGGFDDDPNATGVLIVPGLGNGQIQISYNIFLIFSTIILILQIVF